MKKQELDELMLRDLGLKVGDKIMTGKNIYKIKMNSYKHISLRADAGYGSKNLYSLYEMPWVKVHYELLDNAEKNYLNAVIRPFLKKGYDNIYMEKELGNKENQYWLRITLEKGIWEDYITLPFFNQSEDMYTKIQAGEKYSLKDLGLNEK